MTGFKKIIVSMGALALMLSTVTSWAAQPGNGNLPSSNNPANEAANAANIDLTVPTGCKVKSIETPGFGSFICDKGPDENGMNLNPELELDKDSKAKNILVKVSCGSAEKSVLVESKEYSDNWKLIYSQLLAAQLSGNKIKFGLGNLATCGNTDLAIAKSVILLNQ